MEEDTVLDFLDIPKQEENPTPKDFVINPSARPERRICIYVSRDDRNTDIGKN